MRDFLQEHVVVGKGEWLESESVQIQTRYQGLILYYKGGEAWEHVAQRSYGCAITGSVQGRVG